MKLQKVRNRICAAAACLCALTPVFAEENYDWSFDGSRNYCYANGEKLGTVNDPEGIRGDGTVRGREIFNTADNGWYWLDADADGAAARSKEVWIPYIYHDEEPGSTDGKWVRYDMYSKMIRGWYSVFEDYGSYYPEQIGNRYYYDPVTGAMAKGYREIDGTLYHFDEVTGVLDADESWMDVYRDLFLSLVQEWQEACPDRMVMPVCWVEYLDSDAVPELLIRTPAIKDMPSETILYGIRDGRAVELMNLDRELDPEDVHSCYGILSATVTNRFIIQIVENDHCSEYLCHIEGDTVVVDHTGSFERFGGFSNGVIDEKEVSAEEYNDVMPFEERNNVPIGSFLDFFIDKDYEETVKPGRFEADLVTNHVIIDLYPDHTSKVMFCSLTDPDEVQTQFAGRWRSYGFLLEEEGSQHVVIYETASTLSFGWNGDSIVYIDKDYILTETYE